MRNFVLALLAALVAGCSGVGLPSFSGSSSTPPKTCPSPASTSAGLRPNCNDVRRVLLRRSKPESGDLTAGIQHVGFGDRRALEADQIDVNR